MRGLLVLRDRVAKLRELSCIAQARRTLPRDDLPQLHVHFQYARQEITRATILSCDDIRLHDVLQLLHDRELRIRVQPSFRFLHRPRLRRAKYLPQHRRHPNQALPRVPQLNRALDFRFLEPLSMARAQALEPFGFSSTCDKYAQDRQIDSDDPAELHLET